jgi:hypothetical protein
MADLGVMMKEITLCDKAMVLLTVMVNGKIVSVKRINNAMDYLNRSGYSKDDLESILKILIENQFIVKIKNRFQATSKSRKMRACNLPFLDEVEVLKNKLKNHNF